MNVNEIYQSNYLKAGDLEGRPRRLTIRELRLEELGQKREKKMVMYFENASKGMVLNKTNAMRITSAYGPETDGWVGKPVVLYSEPTTFQGQVTEGLRVRVEQDPVDDEDSPVPF